MLVISFFKKEIMSLSTEFISSLNLEKFRNYATCQCLNFITICRGSIFRGMYFSTNHIDAMLKSTEEISTSLVKIDGIRWLRLAQAW
jgi:hypothetical protein